LAPDAGVADAGDPVVTGLDGTYWRLTFEDDFRGKPDNSVRNTYCYDQLKPQCQVWAGGASHDCDTPYNPLVPSDRGIYPPLRENWAAAITTQDQSSNWFGLPFDTVRARYAALLTERWQHVNKCNWNSYEQLNWWGTDYAGHWTTRHDASRVRVDPTGKGYLVLSSQYAPVQGNCAYGGVVSGPNNVNCQVVAFGPNVVEQGVTYFVDADPRWPGVYYAGVNGTCPLGGTGGSPNCLVFAFTQAAVEMGVAYWVDTTPGFPGVYYANTGPYRCKENTEYPNGGVLFRALSCPIITGAIQSADSDPAGTSTLRRGFTQKFGRWEMKMRIPKGPGAFPAGWLLGQRGGWPYSGGEIDIMEARDAANEVYQTYHNGRCVALDWLSELLRDPSDPTALIDNGRCPTQTHRSIQLSKGLTMGERTYNHGSNPSHEFYTRDHVFSAEWTDKRVSYFVNNVATHTVMPGTVAQSTYLLSGPALEPMGVPWPWNAYAEQSFPPNPMYMILNHSIYVPSSGQASLAPQELLVDYVRVYAPCTTHRDFCPCGGTYSPSVGCVLDGATLQCPPGDPVPIVTGGVYASTCHKAQMECVAGGIPFGPNCQVHAFAGGELVAGVSYWVDADPRWPGVFYAGVNGACPHGGNGGSPNCQVMSFGPDALESGVVYWVDADVRWPGVYYEPDFRQ
jgi:beta-glucanase (GH16 family)